MTVKSTYNGKDIHWEETSECWAYTDTDLRVPTNAVPHPMMMDRGKGTLAVDAETQWLIGSLNEEIDRLKKDVDNITVERDNYKETVEWYEMNPDEQTREIHRLEKIIVNMAAKM